MGLTKNERKTFLSINGSGKIAQSLKESTPGCVTRTLENGRTVHQMEYDHLEGKITNMYIHEHQEYGKYLNVVVDDEYVLQLKFSTRYFYSFFFALPNIDLSKAVKLTPWRKEVEGKVKAALYLKQGGDKSIEWYFTRDNPHGMPDMEKLKVKGKEIWDDTKRLEFIEKYLTEQVFPKMETSVTVGAEDAEGADGSDDGEDLPF
ncbi:hypothetical protein [Chitinophaga japonensis]|uniref:Uncharacterized protein n=1 Tax=Chitinophaga japonensis TaxID=104662 RepID=A0A562SYA9_CHIJA|nr:hypothetical protein [Chitinophaga japonensis]TWI86329.1 hypothetical protein LX66_3583 [Chitinophaga japonensis]